MSVVVQNKNKTNCSEGSEGVLCGLHGWPWHFEGPLRYLVQVGQEKIDIAGDEFHVASLRIIQISMKRCARGDVMVVGCTLSGRELTPLIENAKNLSELQIRKHFAFQCDCHAYMTSLVFEEGIQECAKVLKNFKEPSPFNAETQSFVSDAHMQITKMTKFEQTAHCTSSVQSANVESRRHGVRKKGRNVLQEARRGMRKSFRRRQNISLDSWVGRHASCNDMSRSECDCNVSS
eukprot:12423170-Karenia_brevis.AAC.1